MFGTYGYNYYWPKGLVMFVQGVFAQRTVGHIWVYLKVAVNNY